MKVTRSLILVGLGIALGAFWQSSRAARNDDDAMALYGTFIDAVEHVQANYVEPVDRKKLVESALRGMLNDLDPYSVYLTADDWRQFQRQVEGSYSGIGIQLDLDRRTGRPLIVAPLVGSPAYSAGILAGDVLLEVDGKSTEQWTRDSLITNLAGRPGTRVTLKVLHRGAEEPVTIEIERAVIELESVLGDRRNVKGAWDFMADPEHKIGYIRITAFMPRTARDLSDALNQLQDAGVEGLILDLRDNPGGLLSSAVEVSDQFLSDGTIVSTKGRSVRDRSFPAVPGDPFDPNHEVPIAVLINNHSASASEIVAAALQDLKRARIVGQRSFGKASVQNVVTLEDGSNRLKLTVAAYMRPSGENIHRFRDAKPGDAWGVSPDSGLEVIMPDADYVTWARARRDRDLALLQEGDAPLASFADQLKNDPQLAKAVEVVRSAASPTP